MKRFLNSLITKQFKIKTTLRYVVYQVALCRCMNCTAQFHDTTFLCTPMCLSTFEAIECIGPVLSPPIWQKFKSLPCWWGCETIRIAFTAYWSVNWFKHLENIWSLSRVINSRFRRWMGKNVDWWWK